jgi:NAD-dependent deacetylase
MKNLIVLTGAGISAESGLSTFRDSGGLWEKYRVEDVATPEAWIQNRALVTDFYNQRRKQLLTVEPNEAHKILAQLEKFYNVQIITQNVDNLHERAVSSHVLNLHGELNKMRSTGPGAEVFELSPEQYVVHPDDVCPKGYLLRPHIVWFGEAVPEIEPAIQFVQQADVFVVIGTSMQVYPAAGLIHYVRNNVPIYVIDPQEIDYLTSNVTFIQCGAGEGAKELFALLKN